VSGDWPTLVSDFVERRGSAHELLKEFTRQVGWVSRRYPGAWFTGGQRNDEAVDDLAHRAFTVCAKVIKGRFPFQKREPFVCFVEERFDGKAIRYHSFYAKLSITRELMRDDYAKNLSRDPVLKARANLYSDIGKVLKDIATKTPQGRGVPPVYRLEVSGLAVVVPLDVLEAELRDGTERDVLSLVRKALKRGGTLSQSQLTHLLEEVLGMPQTDIPQWQARPEGPVAEQMDVRDAVLAAWQELPQDDQGLLRALALGRSYDEIIESNPAFKHKVAVTRAVTRCSSGFVDRVLAAVEAPNQKSEARPRQLVEHILEVLLQCEEAGIEVDHGAA
jgi:hypothetical protein